MNSFCHQVRLPVLVLLYTGAQKGNKEHCLQFGLEILSADDSKTANVCHRTNKSPKKHRCLVVVCCHQRRYGHENITPGEGECLLENQQCKKEVQISDHVNFPDHREREMLLFWSDPLSVLFFWE